MAPDKGDEGTDVPPSSPAATESWRDRAVRVPLLRDKSLRALKDLVEALPKGSRLLRIELPPPPPKHECAKAQVTHRVEPSLPSSPGLPMEAVFAVHVAENRPLTVNFPSGPVTFSVEEMRKALAELYQPHES